MTDEEFQAVLEEHVRPLIRDWQHELALQVQKSREGAAARGSIVHDDATGLGHVKANFLEGFYSALTCLDRAISVGGEE